jgi:hypothetical protein
MTTDQEVIELSDEMYGQEQGAGVAVKLINAYENNNRAYLSFLAEKEGDAIKIKINELDEVDRSMLVMLQDRFFFYYPDNFEIQLALLKLDNVGKFDGWLDQFDTIEGYIDNMYEKVLVGAYGEDQAREILIANLDR